MFERVNCFISCFPVIEWNDDIFADELVYIFLHLFNLEYISFHHTNLPEESVEAKILFANSA